MARIAAIGLGAMLAGCGVVQSAQSQIQQVWQSLYQPCAPQFDFFMVLAWSPDGRQIAYSRQLWTGTSSGYDIFVLDAATGTSTKITDLPGDESQPVWSPDGSKLLFRSGSTNTNLAYQLNLINIDGSGLTSISDKKTLLRQDDYSWSPDGANIAYSASGAVYVSSVGDRITNQLTFGGTDVAPVWSPDGQHIAFVSDTTLSVLDVAGGNMRPLSTEADGLPIYWSPDSTRIAFSSRTPDRNTGLRLIDVDGNNPMTLIELGTALDVVWLSDGKRLVFVAPNAIMAMEASGMNAWHLLTVSSHWLGTTISPEGSQIAYLSDNNGFFDLYIANIDGTNPRLLVQNPSNRRCLRWLF